MRRPPLSPGGDPLGGFLEIMEISGGKIIRAKIPRAKSALEESFALTIMAYKLPAFAREYRFFPPRRWRWDFAWPDLKVAVEIEGGIYSGGAHVRGADIEDDHEKRNAGTAQGWAVLYFGPKAIQRADYVPMLRQLIWDRSK